MNNSPLFDENDFNDAFDREASSSTKIDEAIDEQVVPDLNSQTNSYNGIVSFLKYKT